MAPLWLILMFVLQFEGISGDTVKLYHTPGHDAVLPCHILSSATSTCSTITWFYNSAATKVVADGIVKNDLVRAARLRLDKGCNLFIDSITAEDAGLYVCRKGRATMLDTNVVLSVLTSGERPTKPHDDPEDNLTYITVSHVNQGASAVKLVKEVENVTYSTIKTPVTTDAWYVSIP
ncbi:Hypothetical protein SMAX5B_000120 [Scophthalmus maximus]|uniref:Ig-like domain-containing protein n=1 Tax=Scophthalmus maximus TaxID=52904 RepID=A0A2U9CUZ3_SCOMX|nr:Hypothetical protein SMAX5B_000120 [Scophthalmus maximus]